MAKEKLVAIDTFHSTSIQTDRIRPGDKFEAEKDEAAALVKAKLAKKAGK